MTLRLSSAGESHGPALVAIVSGLPAGLLLDQQAIDADEIASRLLNALPAPLRKRVAPSAAGEAIVRGIERRRQLQRQHPPDPQIVLAVGIDRARRKIERPKGALADTQRQDTL